MRGAWSCWTAWSQCSASCGGGHYQRTRSCTSPAPSPGEDICLGLHTEEALCSTQACPEGWSLWSEWGVCTEDGAQSRSRSCEELLPGPGACVGNSSQSRPCPYSEIPVILPASSVEETTSCGGKKSHACSYPQSLSHHSNLYSSQFYRQLSLGRSPCGFKVVCREVS